ncbi:unnamed protein product [Arctia plantaginis]|uniref:Uncharacterized protein n=1 Tax=Arctia plantaginis TaxID=874455 RepID=A0A8S1BE45_ARCPL|nr:unnamed protein product [Arctia plantaginis]
MSQCQIRIKVDIHQLHVTTHVIVSIEGLTVLQIATPVVQVSPLQKGSLKGEIFTDTVLKINYNMTTIKGPTETHQVLTVRYPAPTPLRVEVDYLPTVVDHVPDVDLAKKKTIPGQELQQ